VRRLRLILITAARTAAMLVAAAGVALADTPDLIPCNAHSANQGAVGPVHPFEGVNKGDIISSSVRLPRRPAARVTSSRREGW